MSYSVTLFESAVADLSEAASWYRDCNRTLESDFLLCVNEALARISLYPYAYQRSYGEFRRAMVHRFPFGIIYRIAKDQIIIVAALHTSRNPTTWHSRNQ